MRQGPGSIARRRSMGGHRWADWDFVLHPLHPQPGGRPTGWVPGQGCSGTCTQDGTNGMVRIARNLPDSSRVPHPGRFKYSLHCSQKVSASIMIALKKNHQLKSKNVKWNSGIFSLLPPQPYLGFFFCRDGSLSHSLTFMSLYLLCCLAVTSKRKRRRGDSLFSIQFLQHELLEFLLKCEHAPWTMSLKRLCA